MLVSINHLHTVDKGVQMCPSADGPLCVALISCITAHKITNKWSKLIDTND